MLAHLQDLETRLQSAAVRARVDVLDTLRHASFQEVGYSGRRFDKQTVLDTLPATTPSDAIQATDFEPSRLGDSAALLRDRSGRMENDGRLSRHPDRASVWVCDADGYWRLRYHQGTPTYAFD